MNRTIRVFTDVPQTWMPCELQRLPSDQPADFARGIPGCWRFVLSGRCDPGPEPWRMHFASDAGLFADLLFGLLGPAGDGESHIWLLCPSISERDADSIRASLPSAASISRTPGNQHGVSDRELSCVRLLARLASAAELVASGWHDAYLRYLPTTFIAFSSETGDAERSFESFSENPLQDGPDMARAGASSPEALARLLGEADYVAECWDFDSPEVLIYSRRLPAQAAMDAIRESAGRAGWGVEMERLTEQSYLDWLTQAAPSGLGRPDVNVIHPRV